MKKIIFMAHISSLVYLGAAAQTEQGNWLVGGTLQLNTAKSNTHIAVSPSAGYFFLPNFAAGAQLLLDYQKTGSAPNEAQSTDFGIGPFARYYFGTTNLRPLVEGELNFITSKTTIGSAESTTSTGSTYFLGAGAAAFLNRNVALEGLAGYSHSAYAHQTGSGGFALKVGFQVYLSPAQVTRAAK